MPNIQIDQKTLAATIKALKINAPIYSAVKLKDGTIEITTRNGTQTWKPRTRRTKKTVGAGPAPAHRTTKKKEPTTSK